MTSRPGFSSNDAPAADWATTSTVPCSVPKAAVKCMARITAQNPQITEKAERVGDTDVSASASAEDSIVEPNYFVDSQRCITIPV